jgi:hypothetical protein
VGFFNYPTSHGNYVGWYPLSPGERWRRPDRNLRGGDHSHLQYPGIRNGSERPGDGRFGVRPPPRGVTVIPVEGFNRTDRSRVRPSAPTTEVSDWIRRGARAGLPEIAPTPATAVPAIEAGDRRSARRVAVPPGEIINRPVVTRNRTVNPVSEGPARERRLISPRTPEFVSDSPTQKQRSREEKMKQPAASNEQRNPEFRIVPKPITSTTPSASEDTPRKQRTSTPPAASEDTSRKQRERDSGRREWNPPAVGPAPSQEAKPRNRSDETSGQPTQKQRQPPPSVENKDQNRQTGHERRDTPRPPETRETQRAPESKETRRAPEPKETQRPPEAKQAQPQPQPQPKAERHEDRSERKKP